MKNQNRIISNFLMLIGLVVLYGCQIHKPVPVERINPVQQTSAFHRPVQNVPSTAYQQKQQPAPWSPIVVEPIAQGPIHSPAQEPTQPLTQYQFKPRSSQQAQTQRRNQYTQQVAVTSDANNAHIVRRGENLFSIARQYGMSLQQIASLNSLSPPYEIYPNQKLQVKSSGGAITSQPVSRQTTTESFKPVNTEIQWSWPATGELIGPFQPGVSNGIEIGGDPGRTIRATADGAVLYSGNEVTGYGELVIIDHGNGFMSTYAHNRRLFVKQGDKVSRGQKIAEMGSSEAERTKLHFEIRKDEKPVNPLAYLPKR